MTFTDSCIAKDVHGEPQIFRAGQRVRLHADNCPQIDGAIATVKLCFWQNNSHPEGNGLAVLMNEYSWAFCRHLEVL